MKKAKKQQALEQHHFHVKLEPLQRLTIVVAGVLIGSIALVTMYSETVHLNILGLFCQLLGAIIIGFGLVKTNEELIELTSHYESVDRPALVRHLTRDRFFIVLGIFTLVLGLLLQILSTQLL
jgi:hypothetical protein